MIEVSSVNEALVMMFLQAEASGIPVPGSDELDYSGEETAAILEEMAAANDLVGKGKEDEAKLIFSTWGISIRPQN